MFKKVKQKAYKSKREFRDDLELIWSNCYKYNAAEDHPLRGCVDRLRVKAEKLLRYITDRKERTDPPIPNHQYHHHQAGRAIPKVNGVKPLSKDAPFQETPALVRTPEGMASFLALDKGLSVGDEKVLEQLRRFTDPASPTDSSPRPSKRARLEEGEDDDDAAQLWWNAVPGLVANGVPGISPSSSSPPKQRAVSVRTNPKSLLSVMNANIKTMKRVRGTHAKFAALAATTATGGEEAMLDGEAGVGIGTGITTGFGGFATGLAVEEDVLGEGDSIDERPWLARVEGKGKVVGRGKKKAKTKRKEEMFEGGIDIGEVNAHECIKWMNEKVLEHVGFQGGFLLFSPFFAKLSLVGTSASALAVLAGLTSEYLLNVGRTIRYLVDQYAESMTPEVSFVMGWWFSAPCFGFSLCICSCWTFLCFSAISLSEAISLSPLQRILSHSLPFRG